MKLSTRIRYGVRLMLLLAENWGKGPVFLRDIARTEEISEKYLSLIIIPLRTKGLVNSTRGAHGGYTWPSHPRASRSNRSWKQSREGRASWTVFLTGRFVLARTSASHGRSGRFSAIRSVKPSNRSALNSSSG